jgi:hypothetical protein
VRRRGPAAVGIGWRTGLAVEDIGLRKDLAAEGIGWRMGLVAVGIGRSSGLEAGTGLRTDPRRELPWEPLQGRLLLQERQRPSSHRQSRLLVIDCQFLVIVVESNVHALTELVHEQGTTCKTSSGTTGSVQPLVATAVLLFFLVAVDSTSCIRACGRRVVSCSIRAPAP